MPTDTVQTEPITVNHIIGGIAEAENLLIDALSAPTVNRDEVKQALGELKTVLEFFDPDIKD